jgi:putative Mg2+ transporter-C (MgtC) family protein
MPSTEEMIIRLLIAVLIGMVVGAEREYRNKDAGLRTVTLICMGSCLFTLMSISIGSDTHDRIASNIVTGIGFLGGGVIFKSDSGVNGLTTAATIWMTAALGMTVGSGNMHVAWLGTAVVLLVLFLFTFIERLIDKMNKVFHYTIVQKNAPENLERIQQLMKNNRLSFQLKQQSKNDDEVSTTWEVTGKAPAHDYFLKALLNDQSIRKFHF